MCDWKEPFYKVARQDSRNLRDHFNRIGAQWMEDEAQHNVDNPGRAITKAAANAALWWLMAPASAAEAGTAQAATDAAESGGTLALNAAGQAVPYTEFAAQQMAQQAAQQAAQASQGGLLDAVKTAGGKAKEGWNSLTSFGRGAKDGALGIVDKGLYQAVPGTNPSQAAALAEQTGPFGSYGLGKTMEAAGSAEGLNGAQQFASQWGGKALSAAGKNPTQAMKAFQALNSQHPQPQQQPMQQPRPMQQPQQMTSLGQPYEEQGGLLNLTEEQKKRLRALGYPV